MQMYVNYYDRYVKDRIFMPDKAFQDEGVSYKYLPASDFVPSDPDLTAIGRHVLDTNDTDYMSGPVWTGEALYRITGECLADRLGRGCVLLDRCQAALAAVAARRKVRFSALFCAGYPVGYEWTKEPGDNRVRTFCLALDILARADGEEES